MTTGQARRWWTRSSYNFALAAVVLLAGVAGALAVRDDTKGFCRAGTDLRPKEAPPAPVGPTLAAGIWLTDAAGSQPRHLASAPPAEANGQIDVLQWLPDGRLVQTASPYAADPYPVMTTRDGQSTKVVGLPTGRDHVWSPDGTRVAFVDQTGLATVAADGSGRRQLITFDGSDTDTARQPEWSPDGKQIVFSADSMPKSSVERLEVVNADGSGRRVLMEKDGRGSLEAAWSPDGTEIAFTAGGGYYGSWIGVVRPDGSGYRRIARHCSGRDPHWSPDGRQIVFNDPYSLIVINADGSDMRRIPNTWDGYSSAWSDHGIAFLRH